MDRSSWRWRQRRRARLLVCLAIALCILWLMAVPMIARGQSASPTTSPTSASSLSPLAQTAELLLTRLQERRQQVEDLQTALTEARRLAQLSSEQLIVLERSLTEARLELESLQAALTATSTSLDSLWQDYERLSKAWEAYRSEAESQLAAVRAERDGARLLAVLAGIAAAVLAVVAALK